MLDGNGLDTIVGRDGEEGEGDGVKKSRWSFSSCIVDGEIGITE